MRRLCKRGGLYAVLSIAALVPMLGGCDPTTRAAVEDGVITTSTSLLGSLFTAVLNLALESASGTTG
jgi:hypothetical protein